MVKQSVMTKYIKLIFVFLNLLLLDVSVYAAEPLIVAHRGSSKAAPENTIPAFKLAWKQGADAIEADFHLSKDGHIVCVHDKNTQKASGKKLVVNKSTLAELRQLDVGFKHGEEFKGTVIPTIAEVFLTIPKQKKIYIEIKCGVEIIPVLLKEIQKSGLKNEQIVIISFNKDVIKEMKEKAQDYKAFWLTSIKKNTSLESILSTLKQIKADGVSTNKNNITQEFIKGILEKGYQYHVWTINDVKTAKRFKEWSAMSITTDVPGDIKF